MLRIPNPLLAGRELRVRIIQGMPSCYLEQSQRGGKPSPLARHLHHESWCGKDSCHEVLLVNRCCIGERLVQNQARIGVCGGTTHVCPERLHYALAVLTISVLQDVLHDKVAVWIPADA